jgi:hypothetical protein
MPNLGLVSSISMAAQYSLTTHCTDVGLHCRRIEWPWTMGRGLQPLTTMGRGYEQLSRILGRSAERSTSSRVSAQPYQFGGRLPRPDARRGSELRLSASRGAGECVLRLRVDRPPVRSPLPPVATARATTTWQCGTRPRGAPSSNCFHATTNFRPRISGWPFLRR